MSLDLWIETPSCPTCGHIKDSETFNYTYNVAYMCRLIFPNEQMIEIEGMTGKESLIKLEKLRDELEKDPQRFEELNPKNGWGSYKSFLPFVGKLIISANEFPDGIWRASR